MDDKILRKHLLNLADLLADMVTSEGAGEYPIFSNQTRDLARETLAALRKDCKKP